MIRFDHKTLRIHVAVFIILHLLVIQQEQYLVQLRSYINNYIQITTVNAFPIISYPKSLIKVSLQSKINQYHYHYCNKRQPIRLSFLSNVIANHNNALHVQQRPTTTTTTTIYRSSLLAINANNNDDNDDEIEFEEIDEELINEDDVDDDSVEYDDTTIKAKNGDEDDDDELDLDFDEDELEVDDELEDDYDDGDIIDEDTMDITSRSKNKYNDDDGNDDESSSEDNNMIEWDVDEDGIDYELIDEFDDPDYVQQKQLIDDAIIASEQRRQDENFDVMKFITEDITPDIATTLDQLPFFQQVEDIAKDVVLIDDDLKESGINSDNFMNQVEEVSDLMDDDPYPRHASDDVNLLQQTSGITDDDMIELDETYKNIQSILNKEPWDKVMVRAQQGLHNLSNETLAELDECLGEIGGSAYNVTNWLLYDLDFNVTNLMLAAIQHNRNAPILFQHWYPQLVVYKRYEYVRERNFDFTWDDIEKADMEELQRYYAGFGYDEIPNKAPAETGIINLDELDEEDIKMAAFENWMTDVYNPEADRKDFDDDTMRDEDNVFSDFYEPPQHPDLPTLDDAVDDIEQWEYTNIGRDNAENDSNVKQYRDMMGRTFDYTVIQDEEFVREFRGHVIIACTGDDKDLEIAEKITVRFQQEFGKQVFVETRVMALAREEDNVYEIWIESYDIELLHSKKRALSNIKGWTGPAEIDDQQIDFLTNRVRFLISDDARYSYRLELDKAD